MPGAATLAVRRALVGVATFGANPKAARILATTTLRIPRAPLGLGPNAADESVSHLGRRRRRSTSEVARLLGPKLPIHRFLPISPVGMGSRLRPGRKVLSGRRRCTQSSQNQEEKDGERAGEPRTHAALCFLASEFTDSMIGQPRTSRFPNPEGPGCAQAEEPIQRRAQRPPSEERASCVGYDLTIYRYEIVGGVRVSSLPASQNRTMLGPKDVWSWMDTCRGPLRRSCINGANGTKGALRSERVQYNLRT